jgi:hypothetical protein
MKRRNFLKCAGLSMLGAGSFMPFATKIKTEPIQIERDNLSLDHWWPFKYYLTDEPCTRYEHTVDIPCKHRHRHSIVKRGVATLVGQLKRDVFNQQCDVIRSLLKRRDIVPSQKRVAFLLWLLADRPHKYSHGVGFVTIQLLSMAWGITWNTTDILVDKEAAETVEPMITVDHDIIEFTDIRSINGRPIRLIPDLYKIFSCEIMGLNLNKYQFITAVPRSHQLEVTHHKNRLSGSIATYSLLMRKDNNEKNDIQYFDTVPVGHANIC